MPCIFSLTVVSWVELSWLAVVYRVISGVAYTSECTSCRAGTYSMSGASSCTDCPANTYSTKGSSDCRPCDVTTHFSGLHLTAHSLAYCAREFVPVHHQPFLVRDVIYTSLALMLRCQCLSVCPSVCDRSALAHYS